MKWIVIVTLAVVLLSGYSAPVDSRPRKDTALRPMQVISDDEFEGFDPYLLKGDEPPLFTSAAVDTYCIIWYDFEQMNWQQWTRVDNTAQRDTFCHVDDFSGLGGGAYGGLQPIEGTKSMWCGARDWDHWIPGCPGSFEYLCQWHDAPGYGNDWSQSFVSDAFETEGGHLTLSFRGLIDTEPVYDYISIDYDQGGG